MSDFCVHCGAPVPTGAAFCPRCGRSASLPGAPHAAPSAGPRFKVGPALIGVAAVGLCLCLVALGGVLAWRNGVLPIGTPTPAPVAQAEIDLDGQNLALLEASVGRLEDALRKGDLVLVNDLTHPAVRDEYGPIFAAHQNELRRAADLLATRRLLAAMPGMAEYEVTENGRTFFVTFESWGETWYLSGL